MENFLEKISPIKGAALPKTYRSIIDAELSGFAGLVDLLNLAAVLCYI
jgi:hypothetical protein